MRAHSPLFWGDLFSHFNKRQTGRKASRKIQFPGSQSHESCKFRYSHDKVAELFFRGSYEKKQRTQLSACPPQQLHTIRICPGLKTPSLGDT